MCQAVDDCLVTGYEDLIESLSLPDPDDRHVLAAADLGESSDTPNWFLGAQHSAAAREQQKPTAEAVGFSWSD